MDDGCIGAVIGYVESRLDLSQFDEMPSQDYIAGCIAPSPSATKSPTPSPRKPWER